MTYFAFGALALILRLWGGDTLFDMPFFSGVELCTEICAGNGVAFRISLCLVIFFAFHVIVLTAGLGKIHTWGFMIKFLGLCALVTASFWFGNSSMDVYGDVARVASGLFLVVQAFAITAWAYDVNEKIALRVQGDGDFDEEPRLMYCAIFWSFALIVGGWVLDILFFGWYTDGDGCGTNVAFIVFTIIITALLVFLSILTTIKQGNLFTAAMVSFYCTWMLYTALQSDPSTCNTQKDSKGGFHMWLGIALVTAALSFMDYSATQVLLNEDEKKELEQDDNDIKDKEEGGDDGDADKGEKQNEPHYIKANLTFHIIMLFGSFYMAMLLSNWGVQTHEPSEFSVKSNRWIIMTAQWFCMVLYFWSLTNNIIGPRLCPWREWDDYDEY